MISVNNLTVDFGTRLLFDQVSFVINRRDRIALVGKNGAGNQLEQRTLAGTVLPYKGDTVAPVDDE